MNARRRLPSRLRIAETAASGLGRDVGSRADQLSPPSVVRVERIRAGLDPLRRRKATASRGPRGTTTGWSEERPRERRVLSRRTPSGEMRRSSPNFPRSSW